MHEPTLVRQEILNPTGVVVPGHLGQMFMDPKSESLYQARGRTPADWRLITPDTLVGSFVKIYDFFLSTPELDPQSHVGVEFVNDANAVKAQLRLDGVDVHGDPLAWKTHQGAQVAMARLTFDEIHGYSFFFGFAPSPTPNAMPEGIGFTIEGGWLVFGNLQRRLYEGDRVHLMVAAFETDGGWTAFGVVDNADSASMWSMGLGKPVLAVFVRRPGERRIAPGYDLTLKRALERANEQRNGHSRPSLGAALRADVPGAGSAEP